MAMTAVNKDKEMAAHLRATGYPHGRRRSTTHATHNYPHPTDPAGTARYHRYLTTKAGKRQQAQLPVSQGDRWS